MSCRRAFDLDLADFVARSARPEWADFREHYARCAECSAEVRAWTELHQLLEPPAAHPAEALLLHFETERERLPAAERRAIEEHLAHCASCKDELATLRRFDFTALEPKAAAAMAPAARPSFADRLRCVVLHPAFAYAIVLLLLYPALEGRLGSRKTIADRSDGESRPADELRSKAAAPAPAANLARSERDVFERAARDAAAPVPGETGRATGKGGAEPAPTESLAGYEKAEQRFTRQAREPEAEGWKARALSPSSAPAEVAARELGDGLVLTLPVPEAARSGDVEVRVRDAQGQREMRERFGRAAERVAMRVPAAWLAPGTYTAELRRLDTGAAAAEVFVFRVVP